MKVFCIADAETVRGFRLAGVEGTAVATPEQAAEAMRQAVTGTDTGIIVLTERTAAWLREAGAPGLDRERPLLVEIPGPEGPLPGRKSLRELVQEAVGMRLG